MEGQERPYITIDDVNVYIEDLPEEEKKKLSGNS